MYLGKTKKDRMESTTVGNSMMADLVLLFSKLSKIRRSNSLETCSNVRQRYGR